MNAHIINCDENKFLNFYRKEGYIGVGIVIKDTSPKKLENACRTSYSMYADMKTVFPGDMIFIHAGQFIYGVFKAESVFKEDPEVNPIFLSSNIYYAPNINDGWKNLENVELSTLNLPIEYRQLSISHFIDKNGNNLCFEKGFLANEVFELKRKGKIWSIPEKWRYPDSARTIRPLMLNEAEEFIKLLERENSHTTNRLEIQPKDISNFKEIQLILNPNIVENEKIIEAWLCENLYSLTNIFGPVTSFGNNVQIGYLKGIDILAVTEGTYSEICNYKIIEIKKDTLRFSKDIKNLNGYIKRTLNYVDWIIKFLAHGDPKLVEGYIVAKEFDEECINFIKNYNNINYGRNIHLVKFDYNSPDYNTLILNKVI